jgi:hypothetical protein
VHWTLVVGWVTCAQVQGQSADCRGEGS